jgi:trans-2,3-dihydro-3-hydroxyanthranilate isomerase
MPATSAMSGSDGYVRQHLLCPAATSGTGLFEREFMHLDLFTRVPFGGSRLTLFPDAAGVPTALLQVIAREMGTGETVFAEPDPDGRNRARLRIFTPKGEIPLSGLSILGATCGLDARGKIARGGDETRFHWQTEDGEFPVVLSETDGATLYSLIHEPADFIGQYYQRGKVARALGVEETDIAITGLPCEIVSAGLPIHIVPMGSLAAVQSIRFDRAAAREIAHDLGFGDLFVFTCEAEGAGVDVHCRMFAQDFGIPEDAATGSAAGALIAYMIKHRLVPPGPRARIVCEQGLEMKRPSRLYVEADVQDGRSGAIRVGGHGVLLAQGRLRFDQGSVC